MALPLETMKQLSPLLMMMVQYYVTCYECTHYGGEHGEGNVGKVWGGNKREGTVGREAPHTILCY